MRPAQRPGSCSKAMPASPARATPLPRLPGARTPARPGTPRERPPKRKPPGLGPAAPMRQPSCRGAGSTTAALALEMLLAAHRRHHRTLHRTHRGMLHHRTVHTFGAPHEAARPRAAVTAAEIVTAVTTAAEVIAAKPAEPAQHRKAPLLAFVEADVERPRRVAELLERIAGLHQRSRALVHPVGRIGVTGLRVGGSVRAVDPQLGELARGLLEGRPILFLLGGQREASFEPGEASFTVGAQVLNVRAPSLRVLTARTILRIDHRAARDDKHGGACCDRFPH